MAVEKLKTKYLDIYFHELNNLNIGYNYSKSTNKILKRILSIIYYLENADVPQEEAIKIIELIIQ